MVDLSDPKKRSHAERIMLNFERALRVPEVGEAELSEADYHADPCAVPSLSRSIAHILVSESPRHAWLSHARLGAKPRSVPTSRAKDLDRGSLLHALLLGKGRDIEALDFRDWTKKASQKERDRVRQEGKIPVLRHVFDEAQAALEELRSVLKDEYGIELAGRSEVTLFWQESGQRGPIQCRARLDHLILDLPHATILDPKFGSSANPLGLDRHAISMGYDIQAAAYTSAVEHVWPETSGRVRFVFLPCEYDTRIWTPWEPDGSMRAMGDRRWERAQSIWESCLSGGTGCEHWPPYTREVLRIAAPRWALAQEQIDPE